ncbi:MAG: hypothetical protein WD401_05055 [Thermomicrobiaceae bacterium]
MSDETRIVDIVTMDDSDQKSRLAEELAGGVDISRTGLDQALDNASVRRWARTELVGKMSAQFGRELAWRLLEFPEDFRPSRRDRSTAEFVRVVPDDVLQAYLPFLAASNCAEALWQRLALSGEGEILKGVSEILGRGDNVARETTLHLLILDPYGPGYLSREAQDQILVMVLDDPDPEIRGLAAEVLAADLPDVLFDRWDSAMLDDSERVRMAFWRAALVHRPGDAIAAAGSLVIDADQPMESRRTALLALGENVSTRTAAPVLQALLTGDSQTLAEDAAQLMWRYHRAPDIATAASQSEFEPVRVLAERLLHPELGSPAAGGSRPGDPTTTSQIFDEISSANERVSPSDEDPEFRS